MPHPFQAKHLNLDIRFLDIALNKAKLVGEQHAIAYVEGDKYYGAKATINVWEPKIQQPKEFSLSHFWVLGGSFGEDLNSIEAGWQANFKRYCTKREGSANAI
ncbi:hypothetical protein LguiB_034772 [Lonicera macranthoides]